MHFIISLIIYYYKCIILQNKLQDVNELEVKTMDKNIADLSEKLKCEQENSKKLESGTNEVPK